MVIKSKYFYNITSEVLCRGTLTFKYIIIMNVILKIQFYMKNAGIKSLQMAQPF